LRQKKKLFPANVLTGVVKKYVTPAYLPASTCRLPATWLPATRQLPATWQLPACCLPPAYLPDACLPPAYLPAACSLIAFKPTPYHALTPMLRQKRRHESCSEGWYHI